MLLPFPVAPSVCPPTVPRTIIHPSPVVTPYVPTPPLQGDTDSSSEETPATKGEETLPTKGDEPPATKGEETLPTKGEEPPATKADETLPPKSDETESDEADSPPRPPTKSEEDSSESESEKSSAQDEKESGTTVPSSLPPKALQETQDSGNETSPTEGNEMDGENKDEIRSTNSRATDATEKANQGESATVTAEQDHQISQNYDENETVDLGLPPATKGQIPDMPNVEKPTAVSPTGEHISNSATQPVFVIPQFSSTPTLAIPVVK